MLQKLFLLDGMALVYRAHFALIQRPIYTSKGINSSALFVFTNTLLDILKTQQPSHLAVVFDTSAPTHRHLEYKEYKIQREAMPEELSAALPHIERMIRAFNIPILSADGWEADDIIGTAVRLAEPAGFDSYMVTPDKDFAQLVTPKTWIYKPSRSGDGVEIYGVAEILKDWGVEEPKQVIDILGLWGDTSDNIPGVPGIGEKTASKLISRYGSIENLLEHLDELKGKQKESLEVHRENALLSKRLATICCQVPIEIDFDNLRIREGNQAMLQELCTEFEFRSLGKRLFGDQWSLGVARPSESTQGFGNAPVATALQPVLRSRADLTTSYLVAGDPSKLLPEILQQTSVSLALSLDRPESREASIRGLAFSWAPQQAVYFPMTSRSDWDRMRPLLENPAIEKVGHNLKQAMQLLAAQGLELRGPLFDVELAHSLAEMDQKHQVDRIAEHLLDYRMGTIAPGQGDLFAENDPSADLVMEAADVIGQLRPKVEKILREQNLDQVYDEVEAPLLGVLARMEMEGIRLDLPTMSEIAKQLGTQLVELEKSIEHSAGRPFNLNSPKQLGEILFDHLKIVETPKKTKTGQYATDEQTLLGMSELHPIILQLLQYRELSKLKSTYADALPEAVSPATGRIHTTFHQAQTSTGRLSSQNPNLQNIPIRTEQGREIRRAFIARGPEYRLLSADYSQIELRIIAALSEEPALIEAFHQRLDVHTATAARVYGVELAEVTGEMRSKAKMVNYGIAYGISAFGLAQRLAIPRKEAASIIDQYFSQFVRIKTYMQQTIEFAREHGYAQTVTGRRRYLRDIRSSNGTIRSAAERNAINAPIQGTAADMIKIAMVRIDREIRERQLQSRLILQVHDELVFDLHESESEILPALVRKQMEEALTLAVPIEVEIGTGAHWLEAH